MKKVVALIWSIAIFTAIRSVVSASDRPTYGTHLGTITASPRGIYMLDRAIGFNVLDAAVVNRKTGRITLIGHRDKRFANSQIPYWEHLSVLLKYPAPRFTLPATTDSRTSMKKAFGGSVGERIIDAIGQIYGSGEANADAKRLLGIFQSASETEIAKAVFDAAGVAPPGANSMTIASAREALMTAWTSVNGLAIPSNGIESAFDLRYRVRPEYVAVDQNSLLARVMLEADYLGKQLMYAPALSKTTPGYITDFAFVRRDGAGASPVKTVSAERVWFSIGHVDLAESVDHSTLEIRGVSMRVNIRAFEENESFLRKSSADEKPSAYEARLTAIYPELESQFPVLHELSECAKLAAVARWLRERSPGLRLPSQGLTRWAGPGSLSGHFNAILYVPSGGKMTPNKLILRVELTADGGVSLDPFPGVTGLPGVYLDESVVDLRNSLLTVPPKIPDPTGIPAAWVKNAGTLGEVSYQAATVAAQSLRDAPNDNSGGSLEPFPSGSTNERFPAAQQPAAGANTNAQAQLDSIANSAQGAAGAAMYYDAKGNAMLGFDTAGAPSAAPSVVIPAATGVPVKSVPDEVKKNPIYQALLNAMRQRRDQENQVQQQITQIKQRIDATPPEKKGDLEVQLATLAQKESDLQAQDNMDRLKSFTTFGVDVTVTPDASSTTGSTTLPPASAGPAPDEGK